jgi:Uncharacterized protein conserved in bacteria
MYQDSDFAVFDDVTLPGRLAKIRAIIDPKFTATVAALQPQLAGVGVPVYPHWRYIGGARRIRRRIPGWP